MKGLGKLLRVRWFFTLLLLSILAVQPKPLSANWSGAGEHAVRVLYFFFYNTEPIEQNLEKLIRRFSSCSQKEQRYWSDRGEKVGCIRTYAKYFEEAEYKAQEKFDEQGILSGYVRLGPDTALTPHKPAELQDFFQNICQQYERIDPKLISLWDKNASVEVSRNLDFDARMSVVHWQRLRYTGRLFGCTIPGPIIIPQERVYSAIRLSFYQSHLDNSQADREVFTVVVPIEEGAKR